MGTGRRLVGAMAAAAAFALVAPANAALPTAPNRELNFLHVGSQNPATGLPQVVDYLLRHGVIATVTPYDPSYARVSPSILNTPAEIERTLGLLKQLA